MATVITQTANPAGVSASSNVATYTAASIGTAAPNRIVVVLVGSELASTPIASCTIGGNAMTAGTQGNQGAVYARAFYLAYPTGTTANIAVTFTTNSPTNTQNHIAVYSIVGGTYSSTGADQSTDMDSTDPLTTGSTTIASGGGMIAVAARAGGTGGQDTWSNLGEDLDVDGGAFGFTTAFSTTAGTATRTCTAVTTGEDGAMSWFIFGDNTSPTTALNSPADSATGVSTTPVLDFTGTDAEGNDVRYEVQVATSSFSNVAITNLTNDSDATDASSYNTASITPTANNLVLLSVSTRTGITADPNQPTASGCGLTWVVIDSVVYDTEDVSRRRLTLFRAMGASPSTGAITVDFGGQTQTQMQWSVDEASGVDTSGTNGSGAVVQSATQRIIESDSSATTIVATLAAFGNANNASFGCFANEDVSWTPVAGSGFTLLSDNNDAGTDGHATEWRADNDTTVDITFGSQTGVGAIGIEIKAATQILIDAVSGTDAGFANPDNGGDTDPFTSAENIQYTVQSALSNSTVYYWRVRGIDPSGTNTYGAWATTRSFTTTAGGGTIVQDLIGGGFIPWAR